MAKFIALLSFLTATAFTFSATAAPVYREVQLGVTDVAVPGGFGPNTDAYIVMSVVYLNSCYNWDRAEVTSSTPLTHEVRAFAQVAQGVECAMINGSRMVRQVQQDVSLGHLISGQHTITVINGDGTPITTTLTVE